jgi:hypothetical protein
LVFSADVKDASIVLADETLKFTGKSENKEYEVDIAFFKPVDANGSTYKVLPRSVQMHVMKKDKSEGEFWPRLLQDKNLEKNQVRWSMNHYIFCEIIGSACFATNDGNISDFVLLAYVLQVKVDWDRYVDEDEENEGFDTSAVSLQAPFFRLLIQA